MTPLRPHGEDDRLGGLRVLYELRADGKEAVNVRFRVEGDWRRVAGLDDGSLSLGVRRDELWKATCFELFYGPPDRAPYGELNLSPGGDWATYVFDDERQGMRPGSSEPTLPVKRVEPGAFEIGFKLLTLDWHAYEGLRLLGTAVLVIDGEPTYWSANPCGERPDFHRDFKAMQRDQ